MARIKGAMATRKRRKKVLKAAKAITAVNTAFSKQLSRLL